MMKIHYMSELIDKGFRRTQDEVYKFYYWPYMFDEVREYVSNYYKCRQDIYKYLSSSVIIVDRTNAV